MVLKVLPIGVLRLLTLNLQESTFGFHVNAMLATFSSVVTSFHIFFVSSNNLGAVVAQWLRCCATNRKVIGSIPDGVIGIFH